MMLIIMLKMMVMVLSNIHEQACPVLCSTDRADDDNEDYKQSILMMLKGNLYLYSL